MKNAQNEFGKSAEKSLSATTTTTTATADEQQSVVLPTTVGQLGAPPIRFSPETAENVHNNNATAANAATAVTAASTTTTTTTTSHAAAKMTDEHNHENNNDNGSSSNSLHINNNNNNNNNNNSSGSSIIAEAAKILLKNGLNGTSAAAAALLAAQSFQLPTFPLVSIPKSSPETSLRGVTTDSLLEPPPAHVASTSKMLATTVSSAMATGHSPQRNNGLPSPSHFKVHTKEIYSGMATSSSGVNLARKSLITSDTGVIDCSKVNTTNGAQKAAAAMAIGSVGAGGYSNAGGGRLQFFKDGKFILELARAKDGERGGWVSVPRKQFRTPSATSSTVTPASTASACIYPKIESSTSFSFSDDNSSIQSSPWQRDHCWKQATPKRNISKEMSVYYQQPIGVRLTNEALRLAKLKRRRPFDNTKIDIKHVEMFERSSSEHYQISNSHELSNGKSTSKLKAAAVIIDKQDAADEEDDDRGSTSSVATLVGDNDNDRTEKMESNDKTTLINSVQATSPVNASKMDDANENAEHKRTETTKAAAQNIEEIEKMDSDSKLDETTSTTCNSEVEKMNTSEDGEASTETECKISADLSKIDNVARTELEDHRPQLQQRSTTPTPVKSKTGVEDKRLIKKRIERAKLTTIVQKLIDQMPTRVTNLMKTPSSLNSSAGNSQHQPNTSFLSNKVSPTSSSSTSPSLNSSSTSSACSAAVGTASHRLVEYHQQHVSPRKRILREFEKVSLDDNAATTTGAGGKRSRAKSSANAAMSAAYRNARSPNNRVHSSVCNVPTAASLSSTTCSTTSTSSSSSSLPTTTINGESLAKSNKNAATTAAAPTRLYSSYSIHSLLGDCSGISKKTSDHTTSAFQQPQSDHLFHMRKSVSPKSPEAGGGKSPSNVAHKKRSPPYASPLREAHSRSPTVNMNNHAECSPRATPPTFKQRYDAPGLAEHQHSLSSAHNLHHQQQHHHQQRQGAFYSPYMMSSSKYVPGASGTALTAGAVSPPSTSRSPRHSINAFTSCTTTPATANATPTHYIPNAHRTMSQHRESSPPPPARSMAESPRDSTPRTVPKKTASIRRQFASPTSSSSSSSHSQNTTSNSCPSPGERNIVGSADDGSLMDSKSSSSAAAAAAAAAAAYQQLFQRQSTSAAAASPLSSPLHPAAYYMYPPAAPLPFSSNGASSSGATSSAHTASTSPYIPGLMPPSYYHSYISALNITKHYYMGAGASPQSAAAAAAARLSPPFHHLGIPYNGIAMAAAAAAAFTGQPPAHLSHHSMLPPGAAAMYGVGSLGGGGGLASSAASSAAAAVAANSSTLTTTTTQKTSENNLGVFNDASLLSNNSSNVPISATVTSMRSAATAQHSHNIKDEQSSDVPLNLSKH